MVIASRKLDACEALAKEVREQTGRDALPVACHVGDWEQCDALVDRVVADMRPHVDACRTVPPVGESPPRRTRWQGLLHIMGLR